MSENKIAASMPKRRIGCNADHLYTIAGRQNRNLADGSKTLLDISECLRDIRLGVCKPLADGHRSGAMV